MDTTEQTENESRKLELWRQGITLFNHKEFFECHEVLEDLWNLQPEPEKQLTQGVLQIAVGYLHLGRDNRVGALKLLRRGIQRVEAFRPGSAGLELEPFLLDVTRTLAALESQDTEVPGPPLIQHDASI